MSRIFKKFTAFLIVLTMVTSVMPVVVSAETASGTCGDNLTWVLNNDGTLTISGTGEMDNWRPGGAPWYSHESNIKKVVLNSGVTSIGGRTFYNCSSFTSITIPSSITSIGGSAFEYCRSLTSITIPSSVTSIGGSAFKDCDALTNIYVDSENKYYSSKDGILFNYSKTRLITYPAGKTEITYTIPDSVKDIEVCAFTGCSSLTNVTIPYGVKHISDQAFNRCRGLKNVVIPYSVETIGNASFNSCNSLTSVTIPNSVTSIWRDAFAGCSNLISVTIPNSVTSIGSSAFGSGFTACGKLTDVYYSGTQEQWNNISIGSNNNPLKNAAIHYNSPIVSEGNSGSSQDFSSNSTSKGAPVIKSVEIYVNKDGKLTSYDGLKTNINIMEQTEQSVEQTEQSVGFKVNAESDNPENVKIFVTQNLKSSQAGKVNSIFTCQPGRLFLVLSIILDTFYKIY